MISQIYKFKDKNFGTAVTINDSKVIVGSDMDNSGRGSIYIYG